MDWKRKDHRSPSRELNLLVLCRVREGVPSLEPRDIVLSFDILTYQQVQCIEQICMNLP